jgi:hypothetical protein
MTIRQDRFENWPISKIKPAVLPTVYDEAPHIMSQRSGT